MKTGYERCFEVRLVFISRRTARKHSNRVMDRPTKVFTPSVMFPSPTFQAVGSLEIITIKDPRISQVLARVDDTLLHSTYTWISESKREIERPVR